MKDMTSEPATGITIAALMENHIREINEAELISGPPKDETLDGTGYWLHDSIEESPLQWQDAEIRRFESC